MSPNTDEGVARSFDALAMGLESNDISRAKLIKLGGAALAASALGLFSSLNAEAETTQEKTTQAETTEAARIRHHHEDCCIHLRHFRVLGVIVPLPGCQVCCRRRRVACCGRHGCHCCRRGHCNGGRCG